MKFLDQAGCRSWAQNHSVALSKKGWPENSAELGLPVLRVGLLKPAHRSTWFAQYLSVVLPGAAESLLWVRSWGIWPSCENWHLYDRLRRSYNSSQRLEHEPGHLFDASERNDLATYLQLGLIFGWDMSLLARPDRARLFISHDEYIDICSKDDGLLDQCRAEVGTAGIEILSTGSA